LHGERDRHDHPDRITDHPAQTNQHPVVTCAVSGLGTAERDHTDACPDVDRWLSSVRLA
jgi:hypothetical protein